MPDALPSTQGILGTDCQYCTQCAPISWYGHIPLLCPGDCTHTINLTMSTPLVGPPHHARLTHRTTNMHTVPSRVYTLCINIEDATNIYTSTTPVHASRRCMKYLQNLTTPTRTVTNQAHGWLPHRLAYICTYNPLVYVRACIQMHHARRPCAHNDSIQDTWIFIHLSPRSVMSGTCTHICVVYYTVPTHIRT